MKGNERELLFLVNGDFFRNVRECIIPHCFLVTIHTRTSFSEPWNHLRGTLYPRNLTFLSRIWPMFKIIRCFYFLCLSSLMLTFSEEENREMQAMYQHWIPFFQTNLTEQSYREGQGKERASRHNRMLTYYVT